MCAFAGSRFVVAGVNGQFGRIFARKLAREGASVYGIDLQDSAAEPAICEAYFCSSIADMAQPIAQVVADADYVLLCVPEEAVLGALSRLCELMRDDAVVMDIASVKTRISEALSRLGGRVGYLSLHPMFGPMEDFSGRAICIIPLRENAKGELFASVLEQWGAHVTRLSPQQHDSATALVQALPHAALIAFGGTLASSGLSFDMLWRIATPIQKLMLALAARVVNGEHDTYWSIQSANPAAGVARDELQAELGNLSAMISDARWPDFSAKLDSIRRYLAASGGTLESLAAKCVALAKD